MKFYFVKNKYFYYFMCEVGIGDWAQSPIHNPTKKINLFNKFLFKILFKLKYYIFLLI